jgi:hypothetical protein
MFHLSAIETHAQQCVGEDFVEPPRIYAQPNMIVQEKRGYFDVDNDEFIEEDDGDSQMVQY